jgi:hypothetical protein
MSKQTRLKKQKSPAASAIGLSSSVAIRNSRFSRIYWFSSAKPQSRARKLIVKSAQ